MCYPLKIKSTNKQTNNHLLHYSKRLSTENCTPWWHNCPIVDGHWCIDRKWSANIHAGLVIWNRPVHAYYKSWSSNVMWILPFFSLLFRVHEWRNCQVRSAHAHNPDSERCMVTSDHGHLVPYSILGSLVWSPWTTSMVTSDHISVVMVVTSDHISVVISDNILISHNLFTSHYLVKLLKQELRGAMCPACRGWIANERLLKNKCLLPYAVHFLWCVIMIQMH